MRTEYPRTDYQPTNFPHRDRREQQLEAQYKSLGIRQVVAALQPRPQQQADATDSWDKQQQG